MSKRPGHGDVVYVRYKDHVLFKDCDSSKYFPWIRETIGWLDYEDEECLRIIWERFAKPDPQKDSKIMETGLAILKKAILEIRRID